jgi:hypothetical protein
LILRLWCFHDRRSGPCPGMQLRAQDDRRFFIGNHPSLFRKKT